MMRPYIPKDDQRLPDSYGLELTLLSGKIEKFDVASHKTIKDMGYFELVTKDDEWYLFPINNILKIKFDKDFSKIVSLAETKQATLDLSEGRH